MTRPATLAALVLASAVAAVTCLAIASTRQSTIVLEMDRDLPSVTSGFHPVERHGRETFAWTSDTALLRLRGLDRSLAWRCAVVVRGARPETLTQPEVRLAVDGVVVASRRATNAYEAIEAVAPARPGARGLVLSVASTPTFVPGGGDPRELGVQVDRVECRRDPGIAWPPAASVGAATMGSGVFSLFAIVSPPAVALAAILAGSAGLAAVLTSGLGLYSPDYLVRMTWLALWCAAGGLAALLVMRRRPHGMAAGFAIAFSAGAVFLKLAALLHPSKLVIDALFNAHRLEWVLAGRYYFTQPMPSGVSFPYAIGLYVVAAPFTWLTDDYVMLLRVIVCVAEAAAALLVYAMVARAWGDRAVAAVAVVLLHLVPLPYLIAGNANLPFAFSQSVAVAVVAAITGWRLAPRDLAQWVALLLLCSLAFLSHVGTFPVTFALVVGMAAAFWLLGSRELRPVAIRLLALVAIAVGLSIVIYYGHFGDSYRSLRTVGGGQAAAATASRAASPSAEPDAPGSQVVPGAPEPPTAQRITIARHQRASRAIALFTAASGWPVIALALAGLWHAWAARRRDRLTLGLLAWGVVIAGIIAAAVIAPVEVRFVRYADEFIDRVSYQALPQVAILAAVGAVWAWRRGLATRVTAVALVAIVAAGAGERWLGWVR